MALIDHFAQDAGTEPGENGFARISAHQFTDSLFLWAVGEATRAEVIGMWNLVTADEAQLDALAATYTGLATKEDKNEFIAKLEASLRLFEGGHINAARVATILGL